MIASRLVHNMALMHSSVPLNESWRSLNAIAGEEMGNQFGFFAEGRPAAGRSLCMRQMKTSSCFGLLTKRMQNSFHPTALLSERSKRPLSVPVR